jgi:hypothetical protein
VTLTLFGTLIPTGLLHITCAHLAYDRIRSPLLPV